MNATCSYSVSMHKSYYVITKTYKLNDVRIHGSPIVSSSSLTVHFITPQMALFMFCSQNFEPPLPFTHHQSWLEWRNKSVLDT